MNTSKIAKITGAIVFVATIISVAPTIQSYIKNLNTPKISGKWKVTFNIEKSTLKRYIGKSAGWKIYLSQDDDKVSGKGEMFWVDMKEIPYDQHIPITMEGKIEGNEVKLNYTQNGAKRTTVGEIKLKVISEEIAEGVFSGTAANSSGTVEAIKINY